MNTYQAIYMHHGESPKIEIEGSNSLYWLTIDNVSIFGKPEQFAVIADLAKQLATPGEIAETALEIFPLADSQ